MSPARPASAPASLTDPRALEPFTSMQAARLAGVPFFTVDYWDRSRFLSPTISKGQGRGRGRERMYSYGDVLRLRIARALRDEGVSLETLRAVVRKLERHTRRLPEVRYLLVGRSVQMARAAAELVRILERPREVFGIVLNIAALSEGMTARADRLVRSRAWEGALSGPVHRRVRTRSRPGPPAGDRRLSPVGLGRDRD